MSGARGANGINHGPFHRLRSATQTKADAEKQIRGYAMLGRPARGSSFRTVKAYVGPLSPGQVGGEFNSAIPPNNSHPDLDLWYAGNPDVWEVNHDGDVWAMIVVEVTKSTFP